MTKGYTKMRATMHMKDLRKKDGFPEYVDRTKTVTVGISDFRAIIYLIRYAIASGEELIDSFFSHGRMI